ncbi:MAG: hypothetical protein V2I43_12865 [Parvularcula sp.]|nr:hypothetical protein [Parvularcula sp.]
MARVATICGIHYIIHHFLPSTVKSPDFTAYVPHVAIIRRGYGRGYEPDLEVKSAVLSAHFDLEKVDPLLHTHAPVVSHLLFHFRSFVRIAFTKSSIRTRRHSKWPFL